MIIEIYDSTGKTQKGSCVSDATYGGAGHSHMGGMGGGMRRSVERRDGGGISGMSVCRGPVEVKAGDTMKMISEYDLKKHPLRVQATGKKAEVMGMWTMNFVPKAKAGAVKTTN